MDTKICWLILGKVVGMVVLDIGRSPKAVSILALAAVACAQTVKLEGGLVKGAVEDGLAVYRGIPFAAPPVGDLRWRPPQPAPKWQGIRAADKFGPACPQPDAAIAKLGGGPSEDCLYLNIWTPAKRATDRLPVLVWIHGGGFSAGATAEPLYSGERLAEKGVVVVTIDYRLGVLGFLAHPGLSAENHMHVSGNYGLLDMIAALQWVQKNIAAFGGDPQRMTISGESAGAIAVSLLCASPLAKGLFQGAISQSGGSFGPARGGNRGPGENMQPLADAERAGEAWATAAGASTVADLRGLPAGKLLAASQRQRGLPWPVADGWVVPGDLYKLYQAGRYNDTPILVGYNSDEGALFPQPRTPEAYVESVRQRYGPFAERLLALYPAGEGTLAKTARDLTRDVAFGWHTWAWTRLQSETGKSKAFLYYFDRHPDYPAGSPRAGFGAVHGSDIPYVFKHLGENQTPKTPEDQAMAETICTYWTNFAKHGNPNGKGLATWPAFTEAAPQAMRFAHNAQAGPVVNEEGLKELDSYFAWRRTGGADISGARTGPETTGPYKIVMEMDPSLPQHTVYRPGNLAAVRGKLPVVAFGNGGCANAGNAFENYLAEIASHGFLVVANGPIDPAAPGRPPKPGSAPPPRGGRGAFMQTRTSQLYETMDWAKTQDEDKTSRYFGRLDLASMAVMGQSCGGLQALEAAGDPRVKTAVILNSGIIRNRAPMPPGADQSGPGPMRVPAAGLVLPGSPETLTKLHAPMIYVIGGETDIAYKNAETDYAEVKGLPLFKANLTGAGHDGTLWQPHGGKFAEVATQWLLWQLKGDETASRMFVGENCGLCQDGAWTIERKNLK